MPLPRENSVWPPRDWQPVYSQYDLNRAFWSLDIDTVQRLLGNGGAGGRGDDETYHFNKTARALPSGGWLDRTRRAIGNWFLGTPQDTSRAGSGVRVPSYLASNVARLSASQLTAEPPVFRFIDGEGGRSVTLTAPDGETLQRISQRGDTIRGREQDRLDKILNSAATHIRLYQGAEYAAGMSATALVCRWDRTTSDKPWTDIVTCDAVIPEWRGGQLIGMMLWTMYRPLNDLGVEQGVYYHLEYHQPGTITHALYKGNRVAGHETIGTLVPLSTLEQTADIPQIPGGISDGLTVMLPTGIQELTAHMWRNQPTKQWQPYAGLSNLGRSDLEGAEVLMDQHSMVWTSWMRDIRLGRARAFIGAGMADQVFNGTSGFSDDQEIFQSLPWFGDGMSGDETKGGINVQQFAIRAQDHERTLFALNKEALQHAGWSLASYGEYAGGNGVTATEVTDRTTMSERTRDLKFLYLGEAWEPHALALIELDRVHYGGPGIPAGAELQITIPEVSQIDPEKEAQQLAGLSAARAASIETMVRMQHDDWDDIQVIREVTRIREENGLSAEADALDGETDPNGDGNLPPEPGDPNDGTEVTTPAEQPAEV